jgi:hypothetical protein
VPLNIKHYVFRLKVSVDNPFLMKVLDGKQNLKEVFLSLFFFESDDSSLQVEEFPSRTVFEYHDKVILNLEEIFHVH